jgi:magnesium transporter
VRERLVLVIPQADGSVKPPERADGVRAVLFDSHGSDRVIEGIAGLDTAALTDTQLLWIDIQGDTAAAADIGVALGIPEAAIAALLDDGTAPSLSNGGPYFWVRVVSASDTPGLAFHGSVLTVVSGGNVVISCHRDPIPFIDQITLREIGETDLGILSSASFATSLLDWQISTYFDAVSRFEIAVERLEVAVLADTARNCLGALRDLRKGASRLRRMLAAHRVVFAGMARPDFRPHEDGRVDRHFLALEQRYERAMDVVENARDLVIGSFELFSSKTALQTNEQMRVLTFATVVIGMLAVLAGVLGMNFQAPFFKTAAAGFWWAVSAMAALALIAIVVGKLRKWM